MVELKRMYRRLKRSNYRSFEFFQLVYSFCFRPKNLFISSKVNLKNKGRITTDGPFFFGIFSNWLMGNISDRGTLKISKFGHLRVGKNVRISAGARIFVNGNFTIGNNTFIGIQSKMYCSETVTIGSDCAISWNCQICDSDIHFILTDGVKNPTVKPVSIGNNVWMGSNCIIMKGVTIGDGSVIAAGSLVTKSFPPKSMIGGVPARLLKENVEWVH